MVTEFYSVWKKIKYEEKWEKDQTFNRIAKEERISLLNLLKYLFVIKKWVMLWTLTKEELAVRRGNQDKAKIKGGEWRSEPKTKNAGRFEKSLRVSMLTRITACSPEEKVNPLIHMSPVFTVRRLQEADLQMEFSTSTQFPFLPHKILNPTVPRCVVSAVTLLPLLFPGRKSATVGVSLISFSFIFTSLLPILI